MIRRPSRIPIFSSVVLLAVIGLFAYAALRPHSGSPSQLATQVPALKPSLAPEAIFVSPHNGDTVSNPVTLHMAVGGIRLMPASASPRPKEGHFRVIVDGAAPAAGQAVSDKYRSFDYPDASHVVTLPQLSPGEHTLTLFIEDSNHLALDPLLSDTIKITVTG